MEHYLMIRPPLEDCDDSAKLLAEGGLDRVKMDRLYHDR